MSDREFEAREVHQADPLDRLRALVARMRERLNHRGSCKGLALSSESGWTRRGTCSCGLDALLDDRDGQAAEAWLAERERRAAEPWRDAALRARVALAFYFPVCPQCDQPGHACTCSPTCTEIFLSARQDVLDDPDAAEGSSWLDREREAAAAPWKALAAYLLGGGGAPIHDDGIEQALSWLEAEKASAVEAALARLPVLVPTLTAERAKEIGDELVYRIDKLQEEGDLSENAAEVLSGIWQWLLNFQAGVPAPGLDDLPPVMPWLSAREASAREEGRREGLREAARIVCPVPHREEERTCADVAAELTALAEKPPAPEEPGSEAREAAEHAP